MTPAEKNARRSAAAKKARAAAAKRKEILAEREAGKAQEKSA